MSDYMEYKNLLNLLEKSDVSTVYDELIKKEENVLHTINRVANLQSQEKSDKNDFTKLQLHQIIFKMMTTLKEIHEELLKSKSPKDVPNIFMKDDRKIYLGIFLVILAMFLFFICIST
jgi:hypothetical protein